MEGAPLLELRGARIDDGGVPAVDGLSFATSERKVAILGAPRALFQAAAGSRAPAHGEVLVAGEPATAALDGARVAEAPLDPATPPWTAREYVTWSARLAGNGKKHARASAEHALEAMHVSSLATVQMQRLTPHARRAVVVAAALATGASTILLEDPLASLEGDLARQLAKLITTALSDRAWIVFAGRLPLSSPLGLAADEALVVAGSQLAAQGAPAEIAAAERTYAVRLVGPAEAFATRVAARGAVVSRAEGMEVTLALGPLTTTDLLAIALEAGAVIIELTPLARGFQ